MPEVPVGWTLVNAGERRDKMRGRGAVPALERGPGCCRHGLCRRPSSWGPKQGACTCRVPHSLSCPAYWLPEATGLVALRTVPCPAPHNPQWAGYTCSTRSRVSALSSASGPRLDRSLLSSPLLGQETSSGLPRGHPRCSGPLPSTHLAERTGGISRFTLGIRKLGDAKWSLFGKQTPQSRTWSPSPCTLGCTPSAQEPSPQAGSSRP